MLHKKQESYKFKSKHQFVEINSIAITFGIATAILKDFFHLWSSDLIDHLIAFGMERVYFFVRFIFRFLNREAISYRYIVYEDLGKIRVGVNFLLNLPL